MLASAIKELRAHYPNVEVDVDVTNVHGGNIICREALELFDCGARLVTHPLTAGYHGRAAHVAYATRGEYHLIEHMVEHILEQCPELDKAGWSLVTGMYSPRAAYIGPEVPYAMKERYVVMPAHGVLATSSHKEWGVANFGCLAEILKCDGYVIVQVGKAGDQRLRAASDWFFQRPLADLVGLIRGSAFVVSLENGLSHLAGHLQCPCATLYLHPQLTRPVHTAYEQQMALVNSEPALLSPGKVYEQIKEESIVLWGKSV